MKRTGPLARRTPLRRAGIARGPRAVRRPELDVPAAVRAMVLERCAGRCDVCGGELPSSFVHLHHRLRRSQGGPHEPWNLLGLHAVCHLTIVHGHVSAARACGWLLGAGSTPAAPAWLHGRSWAALDGSSIEHADPDAERAAAELVARWA